VHNRSRDSTDWYSLVFFGNCDFDARLDDLDSSTRVDSNIKCEVSSGGEQKQQNDNDGAVVMLLLESTYLKS
jgi:hypothetical protein